MKRRKTRIIIDILLTAMLVVEMLYSLTGNLLHEVVGMLFFATLVVHMALSFRWFKATGAKSRTERGVSLKHKAMLVACVAIAIIGALLLASSLLISNVLAGLTGWQLMGTPYLTIAYAHSLLAYLLCGAAVVHVALHWVSLFNVMRIPYDAGKREAINVGVSSVAAIGVIALGATAARALDALPMDTATASENCPATNAQDQSAQGSTESSSTRQPRGMERGATKRQGTGSAQDATSATPGYAAPDANGSTDSGSSSGESASGSSSNGGSSSSTSGYCTLCHEHCPLSAPKCNKPYAAGLL